MATDKRMAILEKLPSWLQDKYEGVPYTERVFTQELIFRSLYEIALASKRMKHVIPIALGGGCLGKYWSIALVSETNTWVRIWAGGSESQQINDALVDFKPGDEVDFDYTAFSTFDDVIRSLSGDDDM
jgi:hypothetical protein